MSNKLEQLKKFTMVVADTGDIDSIEQYQAEDATTNPSLLLKVAEMPQYISLLNDAATWARQEGGNRQEVFSNFTDRFAIIIGKKITQIVPGRVSTEVDARLSFNKQATINRARKLVNLYQKESIGRDRILIKIASTWEGIQAAKVLEAEGIQCNLTLLFSFAQAVACAESGAFLISPFVGRILDWYKKESEKKEYLPSEDPGVQFVTRIYQYYKTHAYKTVVMGASFRNTREIEELSGCDRLTISPALMSELEADLTKLERKLSPEGSQSKEAKIKLNEAEFRWMMNEDAMATEKLAEGIRNFTKDQIKLEALFKKAI